MDAPHATSPGLPSSPAVASADDAGAARTGAKHDATTGGPRSRLSVEGLRRSFRDRVALDGVSFDVAPGEILGLLGPNGAGKTTAFRILSGQLPADAGGVRLDGAPADPARPAYRARLGVVFQDPSLDVKLTGRENLQLGAALYGLPRAVANARIAEALELMQLGPRADEVVGRYSGGMKRRLEIARVLLHRPDVLLLDEPGRGVDPETLRRVWEEIERQCHERALSVIVTTHQPEEAERCDRVVFLNGGRVVTTGTPDELRAQVAGDVLRIQGPAPDDIAAALRDRLGLAPRVHEGCVEVEVAHGHQMVPRVVELFPPGRLASVATARPTLADVFVRLTGRGLSDAPNTEGATK